MRLGAMSFALLVQEHALTKSDEICKNNLHFLGLSPKAKQNVTEVAMSCNPG